MVGVFLILVYGLAVRHFYYCRYVVAFLEVSCSHCCSIEQMSEPSPTVFFKIGSTLRPI